MAYVEVWQNEKRVACQDLGKDALPPDQRYIIRLRSGQEVRLQPGQSADLSGYDIRVFAGAVTQPTPTSPQTASDRLEEGCPTRTASPIVSIGIVAAAQQPDQEHERSDDPPISLPEGRPNDESTTDELPGPVSDAGPHMLNPQPPDVEGYRVIDLISDSGGQGTVWRAVQLGTNREVALKVSRAARFGSKRARRRFLREVELAAGLNHPNIASVHDSGVHRGVYYYAMELVDGLHLDEYAKLNDLSQRQILELFRTVSLAIQHAHQRGIIHRDLKPSNIMVTANGHPHVLDFGLAKAVESDDSETIVSRQGDIIGTLPYMSPEQAAGKVEELDTRTDVCSLGMILYQLLTGRFPRDMSGGTLVILQRIAHEEVRRPREISTDIDKELEAILLKALALDPEDRYASAGELAKDVSNYLTGEPLLARKPTTMYFLRKRLWKYRYPLAAVAALILIGIGAVVFYILSIKAEQVRTLAQMKRVQQKGQEADRQRWRARLALDTVNLLVSEAQRQIRSGSGQVRFRDHLVDTAMVALKEITDSSKGGSTDLDRSVAAALLQVGSSLQAAGRTQEAREAYKVALDTFRKLTQAKKDDYRAKRDLCVAETRMGQICVELEDPDQGRCHLRAAIACVHLLRKGKPNDLGILRNHWVLHISMGDLELAYGSAADARPFFGKSLVLAKELARRDPQSPLRQPDLAVTYTRLGEMSLRLDDRPAACDYFSRALKINRAVVGTGEPVPARQKSLAASLAEAAEANLRAGQAVLAREQCSESLAILEKLVKANPGWFNAAADLAVAVFILAEIEREGSQADEAAKHYRRTISILRELEARGMLSPKSKYRKILTQAENRLRTRPSAPSGNGT